MISLARIVVALVSDAFRLVLLLSRPSAEIHAENLVLRKQLAQYIERGVKPRRIDPATRISLALLTRMFDWHNAYSHRASANDPALAPRGMATVLEKQVQSRSPTDPGGVACADSQNGVRKSAVGRRTHCQ